MGYTKLFSDIIASSVWDEDDQTRIVWITMLALKDRDHFVRGTEKFISLASRVEFPQLQRCLEILSSPDPKSRTPDNEGRRIQKVNGGWIILNGERFGKMLSPEERREYNRNKQAEYRKRKKQLAEQGKCAGAVQAINEGFAEEALRPMD